VLQHERSICAHHPPARRPGSLLTSAMSCMSRSETTCAEATPLLASSRNTLHVAAKPASSSRPGRPARESTAFGDHSSAPAAAARARLPRSGCACRCISRADMPPCVRGLADERTCRAVMGWRFLRDKHKPSSAVPGGCGETRLGSSSARLVVAMVSIALLVSGCASHSTTRQSASADPRTPAPVFPAFPPAFGPSGTVGRSRIRGSPGRFAPLRPCWLWSRSRLTLCGQVALRRQC
jgi:hypothetical protein